MSADVANSSNYCAVLNACIALAQAMIEEKHKLLMTVLQ